MTGAVPSKQEALTRALKAGLVTVQLDARVSGVELPAQLRSDSSLRLDLARHAPLQLAVGPKGVGATLAFAGTPFRCFLPWKSIYLILSRRLATADVFWDDCPPAVRATLRPTATRA
jgi:hypothetical protein